MNRRQLLKQAPIAGLMALAATPLARACVQPAGSTVQTISPTSYTVTSTDVTNGYAQIAASWPSAFTGTYVVVGDYSYLKAAGGHNNGSLNCTYMGGITNVTSTGVDIVVLFNSGATNKVAANDIIDVDFIGIGEVA